MFPFQIINDLMFELIEKIKKEYIVKIIKSQSQQKDKIKTLLFTGGAA